MKKIIYSIFLLFVISVTGQNQNYYNTNSGNGYGFRFWDGSESYKIHMGNTPEYKYGPVTDYSIKMNMNNVAGRGWTWGIAGATPIAALNTLGNFQLAGNFVSLGNIKGKKGFFEAENAAAVATVTDYLDWGKYSTALSIGKAVKTNTNGWVQNRFNFTDFYATNAGLPSGAGFNIIDTDQRERVSINAFDQGFTRFVLRDKDNDYIVQFGDYGIDSSGNTTGDEVSFMQMAKPGSHLSIGTWCLYKPDHELTVMGSGWFNQEIITKTKLGVGMESANIPSDFSLAVNGKAIATEIKVQTYANWPDFVFDNSYSLPDLKEVEQHIKEKGHLKDIPSAKEVEENGIYLGEMNAKLLQKIEELTLYTIEQEKKLKEQEIINQELEARLIKLEQIINE